MIRVRFKYYLFFLFSLLLNRAIAQQYNFKNYTPKNGLASSIVINIFQDSKGYLWFATQGGGISRFNGKEFKNFTKNDGLVSNDITCINEDKQGNIWIGTTTDGVSKFDGLKFHNYTIKEGLVNNSVYSIYCDNKGNVWFGTEGGGISILNNGNFIKKITSGDGLSSNTVYAITQDKKENYWFALKNGIAKFDGARIINYDKIPPFNNKKFWAIFCDTKGELWFGSSNGGVIKFNGAHFFEIKLPEEISKDFIGSIAEDTHGNIWFATEHGALKYDGHNYTLFDEEKGLSSNIVFSISPDYEGNIWIGTQQGGANLFSSEAFVSYTSQNGLISNKITSVCQTDDNSYLIGTLGDGIIDFSNNTFCRITSIPELKQSIISSITKDNQNNVWIGTNDGVFIVKKQNGTYVLNKSIKELAKTTLPMIANIIQDKQGAIWIATYGAGVFKIDDNKTERYFANNGLVSDNILTMFKDSKGVIWLGTNDAGVVKLENGNFTNYSEKEGLASKSVWTITEDENQNMYFGTNDAGISCFDGKRFKTLTVGDGLCSNNITTLIWDTIDKSLFVGTDKGINKLKLSSGLKIELLKYYGEQEGFKGGEVTSNAVLIDNEGVIWFGTPNGLFRYNRKYDFANTVAPKLNLGAIRLFYQNVDWLKYADSVDLKTNLPHNLVLSHKNNHLTFDFQALTTSDVKYTYILEGQDMDWSPLSATSEASFTNIAPGKTYTFRAKAVNNNGVWSNDDISFTFTINPPWWQTWWFYTLTVLSIVLGVFGFINYRTAKLAEEKKILEEKVIERTHELKQANTRLSEAIHAITDSMNYAQRIQQSFLTSEKLLDQTLKDYFIFYAPRDIVSGDFYWSYDLPDRTLIACADSTGHGIPGAFMSLIGLSLLNEIANSKAIFEPAAMLNELRRIIICGLNPEQSETGGKDGMDISLISIMKSPDSDNVKIYFSGANSTLCLTSKHSEQAELLEFRGDKQPVGYYSIMKPFTQQEIIAKKGDTLYMFTDGYADQFGGPNGKKFMAKQLKKTVLVMAHLPLNIQQVVLKKTFAEWKGELDQVDDVTVIGVRLG